MYIYIHVYVYICMYIYYVYVYVYDMNLGCRGFIVYNTLIMHVHVTILREYWVSIVILLTVYAC